MKINDNKVWSDFVYNLLYPALLGSMIYEIFSPAQEDCTYISGSAVSKGLMVGIAIFYTLDYLHLYGDIRENKLHGGDSRYKNVFFDAASSCLFFFAFLSIKLSEYGCCILIISLLPVVFYKYKVNNNEDRRFHKPYSIISVACGLAYFFFWLFNWAFFSPIFYLLWMLYLSLLTYIGYVFFYFEKYSKT